MTTITFQEWTGSCALYERFLTLHLGYIHLEASITNPFQETAWLFFATSRLTRTSWRAFNLSNVGAACRLA